MALNALTLSVTSGIQGRPFKSAVNGRTAGTIVEVTDGATPGVGYSNGFVTHSGLPYDLNVVELRERVQATGESKVSRLLVPAVSEYTVKAQALASTAMVRGYRSAAVVQQDGSLAYQLFVEDATGSTAAMAVVSNATPVPAFTAQPSISPTSGIVGATFTATDGTVTNGSVVSRRWLLGGAVIGTGMTVVPGVAGALVLENTAVGVGGTTVTTSSAVTVGAGTTSSAKIGQIAFNVGDDYGQGVPSGVFLDRMKSSGLNSNSFQGDPGTGSSTFPPVSTYNYPTGLPSGNTRMITAVGLRRPTSGTIRYVLRHNGVGLAWAWVNTSNVTIVDSSNPNRVVFDIGPAAGESFASLGITGATTWPNYNPANPQASRDGIAIYELAHETAYLAGQITNPYFITAHTATSRLRFMEMLKINNSPAVNVGDRALVGSSTYNANSQWGIPVEVAVQICNECGCDLHLNMPPQASTAYINYVAAYVRDNLASGLYVYIEYANEVWNNAGGFEVTYNYAGNKGQQLTGSFDNPYGFGWLAAQMIKAFVAVFGSQSSRVRPIFARQFGDSYGWTRARDGVASYEGKRLRDYFVEGSVAGYLSGGAQSMAAGTTAQQNALLAEVANYEATGTNFSNRTVSQGLVDQMRTGTALSGWINENSLADAQYRVPLKAFADFLRSEGIAQFSMYELQNFHINANNGMGGTNGLRVVTMFAALQNDSRISGTSPGSLMRDQYAILRGLGISNPTIFRDFTAISSYGCWGCKDNAFAPDTNLWLFYRWYQDNHPDAVLFELNLDNVATKLEQNAAAATRTFTTFGGLSPAGVVTLKSGTLPAGMTFANNVLSGTPTALGTYALVFSALDGGGNEVTRSITYSVVAFDPTIVAGCAERFVAGSGLAVDGSNNVTTWTDQVSGKVATPVGTGAPVKTANGWATGVTSIRMNGSNALQTNASINGNASAPFSLVFVLSIPDQDQTIMGGNVSTGGFNVDISSGSLRVLRQGTQLVGSASLTSGQRSGKHVIAIRSGGTGSNAVDVRIDGTSRLSFANPNPGFIDNNYTIGYNPAGSGYFMNGDVVEVVRYSNYVSDADLSKIEAYEKAQWGTP